MDRFVSPNDDRCPIKTSDYDAIYDTETGIIYPLLQYTMLDLLNNIKNHENNVLLVEDGSVDVDKLENMGFKVVVYRQGSNPPKILEE